MSDTRVETTSPGHAVEVRGLVKAYGRTRVLDGLDLTLGWNEVVALLGPNGSGKTTLIKTLATLTKPDAGQVRVCGRNPERDGPGLRRLVGVVTHDPMLYGEMTGEENLRFHARLFGVEGVEQRVGEVAEMVGMTARLHQKAATLSHGMQKRISIARALLHDPPVLLLDEPESGLDQEALAVMEALVRERAGPRRAVLMATHNLERALRMAGRMVVLARGRVAYEAGMDAGNEESVREAYFRHTGART
ncbi:MAG: ABC transporter ATP-binding protein [SAR202 cluster bacterium]|nr:ABC transporter ATP-binding protein [SAR202 cluster bacterium]